MILKAIIIVIIISISIIIIIIIISILPLFHIFTYVAVPVVGCRPKMYLNKSAFVTSN